MRLWSLLLSVSLMVTSGLGLLVLSGSAISLIAPPLEARLVVQNFPMPNDFGIDPDRVAHFMVEKLDQRMDDDIGIRLSLKAEVIKSIKELALPRLMNAVVVKAMMREIPELSAILDLGALQQGPLGLP